MSPFFLYSIQMFCILHLHLPLWKRTLSNERISPVSTRFPFICVCMYMHMHTLIFLLKIYIGISIFYLQKKLIVILCLVHPLLSFTVVTKLIPVFLCYLMFHILLVAFCGFVLVSLHATSVLYISRAFITRNCP